MRFVLKQKLGNKNTSTVRIGGRPAICTCKAERKGREDLLLFFSFPLVSFLPPCLETPYAYRGYTQKESPPDFLYLSREAPCSKTKDYQRQTARAWMWRPSGSRNRDCFRRGCHGWTKAGEMGKGGCSRRKNEPASCLLELTPELGGGAGGGTVGEVEDWGGLVIVLILVI